MKDTAMDAYSVSTEPKPSLSVIIPAYNEEKSIGPLLEKLAAVLSESGIENEVIVVDDGSEDATAEIARSAGVHCIRHERNMGYGAALKTGVRRSRFDSILIIDADGTYLPESIPVLYKRFGDAEMVVGARDGREASAEGLRRTAKWILKILARYVTGIRIPDLNSGLRIIDKKAVLSYIHLLPSGFSFTSTITLAMLTNDHEVRYVPIPYNPRRKGSKHEPLKGTFNILLLILRTAVYFNPLKIFLPVCAALSVPGAVLAVHQSVAHGSLTVFPLALILGRIMMGALGLLADAIMAKSRASR